ncbi:unannotated protein [freshwater metagenome]|uniref:Unannotated protein n=1 Tax=freshwater metagenome TaxID=449393 RepID=A0A6J6ADZ4_9ZZZZ
MIFEVIDEAPKDFAVYETFTEISTPWSPVAIWYVAARAPLTSNGPENHWKLGFAFAGSVFGSVTDIVALSASAKSIAGNPFTATFPMTIGVDWVVIP